MPLGRRLLFQIQSIRHQCTGTSCAGSICIAQSNEEPSVVDCMSCRCDSRGVGWQGGQPDVTALSQKVVVSQ